MARTAFNDPIYACQRLIICPVHILALLHELILPQLTNVRLQGYAQKPESTGMGRFRNVTKFLKFVPSKPEHINRKWRITSMPLSAIEVIDRHAPQPTSAWACLLSGLDFGSRNVCSTSYSCSLEAHAALSWWECGVDSAGECALICAYFRFLEKTEHGAD
jgi:hypothetical protein